MGKYIKLTDNKERCSYYFMKNAIIGVTWNQMFKCTAIRLHGYDETYLVKESQEEIVKTLEEDEQ